MHHSYQKVGSAKNITTAINWPASSRQNNSIFSFTQSIGRRETVARPVSSRRQGGTQRHGCWPRPPVVNINCKVSTSFKQRAELFARMNFLSFQRIILLLFDRKFPCFHGRTKLHQLDLPEMIFLRTIAIFRLRNFIRHAKRWKFIPFGPSNKSV